MESEFDNIKEVDYYNSRNFYPSDENATSNSHAIDAKQLRWSPNDNLNNIINEEVKQTTTTTTTTTITTNNGQFDDNLLYSSDNIDLNEKIPSPAGDDNNLHHASTLENNGEELLVAATGGYDNKNDELTTEFDNDQQKILAKNQNQTQQQLGDTDADYGPETCVDVTDDVVMMTENSADTNNLLEQSTLSHSKDTLPSSDNCNPFDNKNALDMEDANEFQLGSGALLQPDDANKSTPLLSPEVEDLPLSCEGGLQYTNEGFQQSPLDEEIPVGIDTHQEQQEQLKFEEEFLQSNGHLSPSEVVKSTDDEEKLDITQKKTEEEEDLESLAKLERFGDDIEEEKVKKEESNEKVSEENPLQQTDLDEVQLPVEPEIQQKDNIFDNTADDESDFRLTDEEEMQLPVEPEIQQKDNIFDNTENDESDFRLKDEEEILEKHVEAGFAEREQEPKESENEVLDLNQRNEVQQTLHNLEADVLEEKPILTGCYLEKSSPEGNFDDLSDEEKLSDFAEEKQDREEFSEKESKAEDDLEKAALPEQKATSIEEIELEEDECIHLEEDVRPSDYLAMLERQKQEREQLDKVVEGFEKEVQLIDGENENENVLPKEEEQLISESPKPVVSEEPLELIEQESANTEELEIEKPSLEDDDRLSDKVEQFTKEQELEEIERLTEKLEEESDKLKEHVAEFEDEHFGEQKQPLFEKEQVQQDNEKLSEQEELPHEELLVEDKSEEKLHEEPEVEEIENSELPRTDENLNIEPEPREQDRIELVSQLHQLDHREKEERTENRFIEEEEAAEQAPEVAEKQTEQIEKEEEDKQIEQLDEFEKEKETEKPQIEAHVDEKETETEKPEIEAHVDENILIEEARKSPVEDKESPLVEDSIAQPEKQWFEEPEKSAEEAIKEHEIDNLVLQQEEPIVEDKLPSELPIEESENKLCEEALEEPEKQLVECTEKQLAAIEALVMEPAPIRVKHLHSGRQLKYEGPGFEEPDPENLEEVQEEIIIKEQVPIKPSAPAEVTSQEPSAVPPTHESSNESEDDEWKYMKEGQGEKQLLGLQGDIVVEEEIQHQNLLLDSGADLIQEKLEPAASVLQEQISSVSLDIESIKHTFENLTQNIAELTESAAAATELTVDKIEDTLENINLSQSSTREKLDNIDDQDISASEMNSKLNPEAKEFIPNFSPTGNVDMSNGFNIAPLTVIPQHFKDEVLAQSPRKGRESNMEDINIPAENEFEEEIANKPHSLPSDEAIAEHAENGGVYEEMNWKEAMHGSEKEEGPLVDSPATDESIEVEEEIRYETGPIVGELEEICAPVDLENAGMKESIYIEHNITPEEEEDVLNTVQVLPVGEFESNDNSFISQNEIKAEPNPVRVEDAVTKEEVQEILALAVDDEKNENTAECETEQKMEQLLLNHDKEITKTVQLEPEQVPINGVEMSPASPEIAVAGELEYEPIPETELESEPEPEPIIEQVEEPSAPVAEPASSPVPIAEEAFEGLAIGAAAAAAVAVAATTAAVKKVEAEKNQKNLSKTSSPATKPKVPDSKKPAGTTATTAKTSSLTAKRTLGEKPKPASSVATKKTVGSTTTAPRPRTAPAAGGVKTPTEKKTTTSTTTSAVKSRIDTKPPSTLASRKPLTSTAAKTSAAKTADSTTAKTASSKPSVASKTSTGSVRTSTTSSTTKPRPATASSAVTTNGTATKTATSKSTSLAPKSAGTTKSLTSPRGTLTSTLRKTEAIKSPIKTTLSSTTTSRTTNSTNGTKTTTSTRTTTTKTSSAPTAAARTTTTTTTRRPVTGTPSSGGTTPTSKSNSLVSRKSTPLKKTTTSSSSTPTARKSIGSKLNASATKATKENAIARPAPITAPIPQKNNDSIINEEPKDAILLSNDVASSRPPIVDNGEPKLNGIASPDDVTSSAVPLGMEVA